MISDQRRRGDVALARFRALSSQRRVLLLQSQYFIQKHQRTLSDVRRLLRELRLPNTNDTTVVRQPSQSR